MIELAGLIIIATMWVFTGLITFFFIINIVTKNIIFIGNKWRLYHLILSNIYLSLVLGTIIAAELIVMGTLIEYPKYKNCFELLIFLASIFLVIHSIYEILMCYKNILRLLVNIANFTKYYGIGMIFILNLVKEKVSFLDAMVLLLIFTSGILSRLIGDYQYKQIEDNYDGDIPCSEYNELFSSRKKQINAIINILDSVPNKETFALMVRGKWGIGKTSLINGLISKIRTENVERAKISKGYEFITISAGYTKNVEEILSEIEKQMLKILSENNYYWGNSREIKNYFKIMCSFAANAVFEESKLINYLYNEDISKDSATERMNNIISGFTYNTGKRIVIIIDDIERCQDEVIKYVFSLLMETTKLCGCITIVVCDYEQLTQKIDKEFLDKYFGRHYEVHSNIFEEMLEEYPREKEAITKDGNTNRKIYKDINNYFEYLHYFSKYYKNFCMLIDSPSKLARQMPEGGLKHVHLIDDVQKQDFREFVATEKYIERFSNPRIYRRMWNIGIRDRADNLIHLFSYGDIKIAQKTSVNWSKVLTVATIFEYIMQELYDNYPRENRSFKLLLREYLADDKEIRNRKRILKMTMLYDFSADELEALEWVICELPCVQFINKNAVTIQMEWNSHKLTDEHLNEYLYFCAKDNLSLTTLMQYINRNLERLIIDNVFNLNLCVRNYQYYFEIDDYGEKVLTAMIHHLDKRVKMLRRLYDLGKISSVQCLSRVDEERFKSRIFESTYEVCFDKMIEYLLNLNSLIADMRIFDDSIQNEKTRTLQTAIKESRKENEKKYIFENYHHTKFEPSAFNMLIDAYLRYIEGINDTVVDTYEYIEEYNYVQVQIKNCIGIMQCLQKLLDREYDEKRLWVVDDYSISQEKEYSLSEHMIELEKLAKEIREGENKKIDWYRIKSILEKNKRFKKEDNICNVVGNTDIYMQSLTAILDEKNKIQQIKKSK